jgi:hypothetical protein
MIQRAPRRSAAAPSAPIQLIVRMLIPMLPVSAAGKALPYAASLLPLAICESPGLRAQYAHSAGALTGKKHEFELERAAKHRPRSRPSNCLI